MALDDSETRAEIEGQLELDLGLEELTAEELERCAEHFRRARAMPPRRGYYVGEVDS